MDMPQLWLPQARTQTFQQGDSTFDYHPKLLELAMLANLLLNQTLTALNKHLGIVKTVSHLLTAYPKLSI